MSAEPLPTPTGSAARSPRAEGLSRSMPGRHGAARRPVLALVATPTRAKRAPFVALLLGILLAGLVGLLLLNTASAQDAFRLHRLQASAANASDARQALSEQVNTLTGPAGLAMQAQQMGMVPMGVPEFWKPGTPLPPGARIVDGMVIVPAAGAKPAPSAAPSATAPPPDAVSVTSVPRPGQKASTSTTASPSGKTSTAARPSTGSSTKTPTKSGTKPSAKATAKSTTKSPTQTTTTRTTTTPGGVTRSGAGSSR